MVILLIAILIVVVAILLKVRQTSSTQRFIEDFDNGPGSYAVAVCENVVRLSQEGRTFVEIAKGLRLNKVELTHVVNSNIYKQIEKSGAKRYDI